MNCPEMLFSPPLIQRMTEILHGLKACFVKKCGMGIVEMKEYVALCLEGENSISKRKNILDKKKTLLEEKLQEVQGMH